MDKFYCERQWCSGVSVAACIARQNKARPGEPCHRCPQGSALPGAPVFAPKREAAKPTKAPESRALQSRQDAAAEFNRLAKGRWRIDPDHLAWVPKSRFSWRAGVGQTLRCLGVEDAGDTSPELLAPIGEALALLLLRPNVGDPEWVLDTTEATAREEAWCVEAGARLERVRGALLEARRVAEEIAEADGATGHQGTILERVDAALAAVDVNEKRYREEILAKSAAQPRTRGASAKQQPGRPMAPMRRALRSAAQGLAALGLEPLAILRGLQASGLVALSERPDYARRLLE